MVEIKTQHVLPIIAILLALVAIGIAGSSYKQIANEGLTNEDVLLMIENNPVEHEHELESHTHNEIPIHSHPNLYSPTNHVHQYASTTHTHGSSSSGGTADFDLTISRSNVEVGDSFLLEGDDARNPNTGFVAIMESANDGEQSQQGNTNNNGQFSAAFVIPSSWDGGVYKIIVYLDGKTDEIVFNVRD